MTDEDQAWAGLPIAEPKKERKKPFQNPKPRSDWKRKKYGDRARAKIKHQVYLGEGSGVKGDVVDFDIKLTSRWLIIHRYRGHRSKDFTWTLDLLVKPALPAGKSGQIRLL